MNESRDARLQIYMKISTNLTDFQKKILFDISLKKFFYSCFPFTFKNVLRHRHLPFFGYQSVNILETQFQHRLFLRT